MISKEEILDMADLLKVTDRPQHFGALFHPRTASLCAVGVLAVDFFDGTLVKNPNFFDFWEIQYPVHSKLQRHGFSFILGEKLHQELVLWNDHARYDFARIGHELERKYG